MTTLDFKREQRTSTFLDPRQGYAPETVTTEFRADPLTGATSRICHFARDRVPQPELAGLVETSKGFCPFCPGVIEQATPKYPPEFLSGGVLTCGTARLFPNLFPYDDISAVVAISDQHHVPMAALTDSAVPNGLKVARAFLEAMEKKRPLGVDPAFSMVMWNYMPPSGSSLVHPHMQVLHTRNPGNALRRELAAEIEYRASHGRAYLSDLVAHEAGAGERWIGELGGIQWLVPFSPTGMVGDCIAVFPGRATFTELDDGAIGQFAHGLQRVLRSFSDYGVWSFNLGFFPATAPEDVDHHWLYARIVPRVFVNPATSAADASYLQFLIEERVAMVYPEVTAERLRASWASV
ncbi:MAG: hypothetical protein SV583_09490 [Pseudomonadota bacterium]|nr:hypothetical protein [Pseudomonadota bacterium]